MKEIQPNELLICLEDGRILVVAERSELEDCLNGQRVVMCSTNEVRKAIKERAESEVFIASMQNEIRQLNEQMGELMRRCDNHGPTDGHLKVIVTTE